jgi:hypothetical protein
MPGRGFFWRRLFAISLAVGHAPWFTTAQASLYSRDRIPYVERPGLERMFVLSTDW